MPEYPRMPKMLIGETQNEWIERWNAYVEEWNLVAQTEGPR